MSHAGCLVREPAASLHCGHLPVLAFVEENRGQDRSTRASPAKVCKQSFGDLFGHCLWLLQEAEEWAFTMGIVVETSECCNPWQDIISQLRMNNNLLFFAKKSSSPHLPYILFVRYNFSSHPKQPPVVSYPPRSQSICYCIWSCERKMQYYAACKKVKKQDH